jgi:two-component system OmpR family sensor kinase
MRHLRLVSVRARLLAGLVVLAAIGLFFAGFATYRAERSFLYGRAKAQLLASIGTLEDDVAVKNHLHYDVSGPAPRRKGRASDGDDGPASGATSVPASAVHPLPPNEDLQPPPGTFGEHLSATGKPLGESFAYAIEAEYAPAIPKDFKRYVSTHPYTHPHIYSTPAAGDPSVEYLYLIKRADVGYGYTLVAVSVGDVRATLSRLQEIEAIVVASVLVALGILGWFVIRLGLRPLDRIGTTAGAIAAGDLSRRVSPADERTEVGRLGLALNAMLGQIERAFAKRQESEERLRRFLSDASHELRTPLTSIRGYAELFRLGAASSPDETAKAMARIEQESSRMGILVDELLALARLDEMPQTTREPVDLAPLVRDAGDDAGAVAPDRAINVSVEPASSHIVSGDPHQLRQVLANLMTNAVRHTPAGTPIDLSLVRDNGFERIEVRDHGPGLPGDAHEAVFERFWRAEVGRERGKAGAGLGLSIVAEIVRAHDGRVSARNASDGGAVFVIELRASSSSSTTSDA